MKSGATDFFTGTAGLSASTGAAAAATPAPTRVKAP